MRRRAFLPYRHTLEVARVAGLDCRQPTCRTLQRDSASSLVDAGDSGDDCRDPCLCSGGLLAELGTGRFLGHGGTGCGCVWFLHFVGDRLEVLARVRSKSCLLVWISYVSTAVTAVALWVHGYHAAAPCNWCVQNP